jgi:hypothetical protein
MSVIITGRRISGLADQRASLGNDQIIRQIQTGSWNKIRVGMRMCVTVQSAISGTPKLYIGVSNNSNAAGNNGAGSRVVNHFVGALSTTASWAFTPTSPGYYTVAFTSVRRITATDTTSGSGTILVTADPTSARCFVAVDIDKTNSAAVSIDMIGPSNSVSGIPDISLPTFISQLKTDAVILDGYIKNSLTTTLSINEGTNGALNSVNISWMKTLERLEFSDVSYHIFS